MGMCVRVYTCVYMCNYMCLHVHVCVCLGQCTRVRMRACMT